jgi:hypothetical protein
VPCGAVRGWDSKGQSRGGRRRREHRKERVKRATEERGERAPASRLGLRRCSPSVRTQPFIPVKPALLDVRHLTDRARRS